MEAEPNNMLLSKELREAVCDTPDTNLVDKAQKTIFYSILLGDQTLFNVLSKLRNELTEQISKLENLEKQLYSLQKQKPFNHLSLTPIHYQMDCFLSFCNLLVSSSSTIVEINKMICNTIETIIKLLYKRNELRESK